MVSKWEPFFYNIHFTVINPSFSQQSWHMPDKKDICALIPAYNESATIASVVRDTLKYVQKVIVVDDGSMDGTYAIAMGSGAYCLKRERNSGKGEALRYGINYIKNFPFHYVVFLDGDGQHRPGDIPSLIRTVQIDKADMVIGARSFIRDQMPLERFFSNNIGSKITSMLLGTKILDSQSGFRLIRLDRLKPLRLRAKKYEIEMEILIKMSLAGCKIAHAPISMVYGSKHTSKMHPIRDTIRICLWSLLFRFGGL